MNEPSASIDYTIPMAYQPIQQLQFGHNIYLPTKEMTSFPQGKKNGEQKNDHSELFC